MTPRSEVLLKIKVLTSLQDALKLLEKPGAWTKYTMAKNRRKEPVDPTDKTATCFCLVGALKRSSQDETVRYFARHVIESFIPSTYPRSALTFNDAQQRKGPVLNLLKKAIKKVQEEGVPLCL